MATAHPFSNAGLGQFGRDVSYAGGSSGGGGSSDLSNFLTAYVLNKTGLQKWMDEKKTEIGDKPVAGASVPTAATAATSTTPVSSAVIPPSNNQVIVGGAIPTSTGQITPLPELSTFNTLATDDDGHSILKSGMTNNQGN